MRFALNQQTLIHFYLFAETFITTRKHNDIKANADFEYHRVVGSFAPIQKTFCRIKGDIERKRNERKNLLRIIASNKIRAFQ